jgi:opacity protein-like surface antigen
MQNRIMTFAVASALTLTAFAPGALAAVGAGSQPSVAAAAATSNPIETIGCYRLGGTGYHWYHWCAGPRFLYPHHRVCHHGHCWYH